MFNKEGSLGEKIYQAANGIETNSQHFIMADGETYKDIKNREAAALHNDMIESKSAEIDAKIEKIMTTVDSIMEEGQDLEIMPPYKYILVKPYSQNPFQKVTVQNGLIVDLGGFAPTYKSKETGEFEEEKSIIELGQVLEVGPEVMYVRPGDVIYYKEPNKVPVPFFKLGLVMVNEMSVHAIVNKKLKERFESC